MLLQGTWKLFFKFWILCLYRIVNFQCRGYWNWQKLKNLLQQVKDRNYLDFHSVSFERTWRKLVQKRTVRTRLDIHVFRSDCLDLCGKTNCIVICSIMKIKFKESTIHPISTITSNLKSLNIKQTTAYGIENQGHYLERASNCEVVLVWLFRL
jgi:hypothetical protein